MLGRGFDFDDLLKIGERAKCNSSFVFFETLADLPTDNGFGKTNWG